MTIVLPLAVALVGVLTYALSESPKLQEIGRICFFCGLLVTLSQAGPTVLSALR